jgi:hypothetical protein
MPPPLLFCKARKRRLMMQTAAFYLIFVKGGLSLQKAEKKIVHSTDAKTDCRLYFCEKSPEKPYLYTKMMTF